MSYLIRGGLVGVRGLVLVAVGGLRLAAAEPVLHRVVLSSGGVGQFEFGADVDGAAALTLDVKLDQVDDVLKSLVVEDPAGAVQSVRLPGQQPLSESFRTLPFQPEAFASAEALLASLVGERVRIASIGARGVILSVSAFELPAAPGQTAPTRHRLTLATDDGLVSTVLEDSPDIAFTSDTLRGQIAAALAAIAAQRVQDRRTLTITLAPGAARHVRFGYVVPVPVWKTSYRLTLPADTAKPARLEAFAVVENLSGLDWKDVSVTLTSGQPVLFHTPLYQPVFSQRPEAPVEEAARLAPSVDRYAALAAVTQQAPPPPAAPAPPPPPSEQAAPPPFYPPPEGKPVGGMMGAAGNAMGRRFEPAQVYVPPPVTIAQSVAQVAFQLAAPVTAGSGQSMLLPIMDRALPAKRIALFQPGADPVHPLVAVQLDNDTDGAFPPGLVTLFDTDKGGQISYVGDARLPAIEPGEQRLASFALDLAVTIDAQHHSVEHVTGGTIVDGSLTLQQRDRQITDYRVTTPKGAPRTIAIEQPKAPDDPLVEPTGASVTTTPEVYRVTRDVPAGTTQTITLTTERTVSETHTLTELDTDASVLFASNTEIAAPIRHAVQHAADLRAEAEKQQTALAALRAKVSDITLDQSRIRQNLQIVPANSTLQRRYLASMQEQENRLDELQSRIDAAQKQVDQANDALAAYVAGLKL